VLVVTMRGAPHYTVHLLTLFLVCVFSSNKNNNNNIGVGGVES
jgi:hypothetical protein